MRIQPKELATRSINRRRGPMSCWACTISCPQQFKTLDTESFGEYFAFWLWSLSFLPSRFQSSRQSLLSSYMVASLF